ncbi:HD domain-containing phosphohydrolase [Candidatus Omnitrophota bacterium]
MTHLDYKKELETAAKTMILVHDPKSLIRMVVRMMNRKIGVTHAGILLYDKLKESYVLTVSRGEQGIKIPAGYARIDNNNALIKFFKLQKEYLLSKDGGALVYDNINNIIWKDQVIKKEKGIDELLHEVKTQMELFAARVCIPSYYRKELLGVLILGRKNTQKKFFKGELDFFVALAYDVAMAIRNAQLFEDLQSEVKINHELFINTTVALAEAIEAKDHYTGGHTERVTKYSLLIAEKVLTYKEINLPQKFLENLHIASLLHDIGKIAIPEAVLNKPGKLTDEEFAKIKSHPIQGIKILQPIKELEEAIKGVKYHHERYDGRGYPEGLKGDEIPLIAAIIAVADVYDAMTSDRPYRPALPKETAIGEIKKGSGTQFTPIAAKAFLELCEEGKI